MNKCKILIIIIICILLKFLLYKNENIVKISIFLPIYNKEKYLKRSIGSIQNQTLKEIEIIAVNDYSSDNSLRTLQNLAKNDSRIKIINNKKNYGLLYSRAMGILNSKGEYIMNLDPDDELEGKDNLEFIYKKISKYKADILSFATLFKSKNETIIKCSNFHTILKQPKILESSFNYNNILDDYLIWNKLIKRKIFMKAYLLFKDKIYSEKWNFHEDNIWSLLINKLAKSMICTDKLIYIYYTNDDSFMFKREEIKDINDLIYRHEMFKKILSTKNPIEEKYIKAEVIELIYIIGKKKDFMIILKNNIKLKRKLIKILVMSLKTYNFSKNNIEQINNFINNILE